MDSAKKSTETKEQRRARLKKVVARAKANKKNQELQKTGRKIIQSELKKAGKKKPKRQSAGSTKTTATTSRTKKKSALPKSKVGKTIANRSRKINAAVNRAGG